MSLYIKYQWQIYEDLSIAKTHISNVSLLHDCTNIQVTIYILNYQIGWKYFVMVKILLWTDQSNCSEVVIYLLYVTRGMILFDKLICQEHHNASKACLVRAGEGVHLVDSLRSPKNIMLGSESNLLLNRVTKCTAKQPWCWSESRDTKSIKFPSTHRDCDPFPICWPILHFGSLASQQ